MRLYYAFFCLIAIVASTCIPLLLETPKDAARIARRLVRDTTIGTLATTMNTKDREGLGGRASVMNVIEMSKLNGASLVETEIRLELRISIWIAGVLC